MSTINQYGQRRGSRSGVRPEQPHVSSPPELSSAQPAATSPAAPPDDVYKFERLQKQMLYAVARRMATTLFALADLAVDVESIDSDGDPKLYGAFKSAADSLDWVARGEK